MIPLVNLQEVFRISLVTLIYLVCLIIILRIFGKRTLSKMNAFDFVVTIALGSIFATLVLDASISLASGITAMLALIFYQFIISGLSVRSKKFTKTLKASPALLYYDGLYYTETLKKERVTIDELKQAVRSSGFSEINEVGAIVLETDGTLSVIEQAKDGMLKNQ